jgi:2-isopropylmalate synthase
MRVYTFDTTLRDGTQGEGVSLSVDDKLTITQKLDSLGIDYIEGGWPGSNPKDKEFFIRVREVKLEHARVVAFGSTRLARNTVQQDPNVIALIEAGTPVVSIFGKTWDLHVTRGLGIDLEENLKLISETVRHVRNHEKEVVYDAEHFFDGFTANPSYALRTLEAAKTSGAHVLCLCDTNGGSYPTRIGKVVTEVRRRFDGVIGIHTHNDSELAVANAVAAVEAGATMVQGCLNGWGERCGNANLASIIAILELRMGCTTIGREKLASLSPVCRLVADVANLPLPNTQPFVGKSAFAHKGGIHVSAVLKDPITYEHIAPETVGNLRRVLVSDLAGRANLVYQLREKGMSDHLDENAQRELLARIKQLEHEGYDLESADGSFELLVRSVMRPGLHLFDVVRYELITGAEGTHPLQTRATVTLRVQGQERSASASDKSPVGALNTCLKACLESRYPQIKAVQLTDYKVRLLSNREGEAARVRVLINWTANHEKWSTVGVSHSVVEASWNAQLDAMRLQLMRLAERAGSVETPAHTVLP